MANDLGIPVSDPLEEWEKPIQTIKDAYATWEFERKQSQNAHGSAESADHSD